MALETDNAWPQSLARRISLAALTTRSSDGQSTRHIQATSDVPTNFDAVYAYPHDSTFIRVTILLTPSFM
jgi:hypothetical protein